MKSKKTVTIIIMILSVVFIFTACGAAETIESNIGNETENKGEVLEPGETEDPNNPTPLAASLQTLKPEEIFRFETTALYDPDARTINPDGMLLNIGCEDCQDIFYASRSLSVEEVIEKIKIEFGIVEMIFDENFVRFDINIDDLPRLEKDLNLIAAKKLTLGDEILDVRIISIKP